MRKELVASRNTVVLAAIDRNGRWGIRNNEAFGETNKPIFKDTADLLTPPRFKIIVTINKTGQIEIKDPSAFQKDKSFENSSTPSILKSSKKMSWRRLNDEFWVHVLKGIKKVYESLCPQGTCLNTRCNHGMEERYDPLKRTTQPLKV